MFDTEAHRPYVALCRELRLERDHEIGDWWYNAEWANPFWLIPSYGPTETQWSPARKVGNAIWLPRLDQWVAKLRVEGIQEVILRQVDGVIYGIGYDEARHPYGGASAPNDVEAAARLWLAVTEAGMRPAYTGNRETT